MAIVRVGKDVSLLCEKREMAIVRERKEVSLLRKSGKWLL